MSKAMSRSNRIQIAAITLLYSMLFSGGVFAGSDEADKKTVLNLAKKDRGYIYKIEGQGSSKLHKMFFDGDTNGKVYKKFIKNWAGKLEYSPDNFLDGTVAYADGYPSKTMTYTKHYQEGLDQLSLIKRISVVFHEAAHNDKKTSKHVFCPHPFTDENGNEVVSVFNGRPIAGMGACDSDHSGAFAIQFVFLTNISEYCNSCSEDEKQEAREVAESLLIRILSEESKTILMEDIE